MKREKEKRKNETEGRKGEQSERGETCLTTLLGEVTLLEHFSDSFRRNLS
jgi:hypothetical protein